MKSYVLLTESGSDLPVELTKEYGIKIVPMYVLFKGVNYADGEISSDKILASKDAIPTTSAPNPIDFENMYRQIRSEIPDSIIIHIAYSAKTTSSYQNALIAAANYQDIYHIDSEHVSGGLGSIVIRTARFIKDHPTVDLETLLASIKGFSKQMKFCFVVNDSYYLKAGGRCSNTKYLLTQILNIKPLIEMKNGLLVATKKYRGSMNRVSKKMLSDFFSEQALDLEEVYLVYTPGLSKDTRQTIEEICLGDYGVQKITWIKTGCIISTHGGPGAFGVGGFLLSE